jgi:hypothetical protein
MVEEGHQRHSANNIPYKCGQKKAQEEVAPRFCAGYHQKEILIGTGDNVATGG